MSEKEKEIKLKYLNDMEMLKIDETYAELDKLAERTHKYLEGERLASYTDPLWSLDYIKRHIDEIHKIREDIKELKGEDDLI